MIAGQCQQWPLSSADQRQVPSAAVGLGNVSPPAHRLEVVSMSPFGEALKSLGGGIQQEEVGHWEHGCSPSPFASCLAF